LALLVLVISCKKHDGFTISGKITNAEEKYLYLDELRVASSIPIDSVKIKKNGSFEFKGKVSYPNFFLLRLNKKNFVTLLVDTTEQITVFGDAANFARDYVVEGSPGSLLVQELNNTLTETKHKLDSIRSRMILYRGQNAGQIENERWQNELITIKQAQIDYSKNFVQKHPFSMASVLALYQKFDDSNYVIQDLQSLKVAASALNSIFPNSEHVKALYDNTQRLMIEEQNLRLKDYIEKNGANSPEIRLPDQKGTEIALSSLIGKVVLIQFWAAIDKNSRIQNEALVELYNRYHSKGFEIYQVSIDEDRNLWQTAIAEDGLKWINVGDMKGSHSATISFNVQRIPSNYILDREGQIAARDLTGPKLNQAVGILVNQ
jgi:peroxiredoxin